jgi:hypothetical protein
VVSQSRLKKTDLLVLELKENLARHILDKKTAELSNTAHSLQVSAPLHHILHILMHHILHILMHHILHILIHHILHILIHHILHILIHHILHILIHHILHIRIHHILHILITHYARGVRLLLLPSELLRTWCGFLMSLIR